MATYLFVWMIVAGAGDRVYAHWKYGWVNTATFSSQAACQKAIKSLGLPETETRCVSKD